jgi:DNA-damage-inducible protein D
MPDNPKSPANAVGRASKGETIGKLLDAFEAAAHADDDGVQYWFARELAPMLGYSEFRNFTNVVAKAKVGCVTAGEDPDDHFVDVTKMVALGSGAQREIDDIELTRFACYLIAQNGDSSKTEIAAAQMYFAVQTRRQEIADQTSAAHSLTEDEKRVLLRDEIKGHNKSLASAARAAAVEKPLDYAVFKNEGYKGLYGGLDRTGIQRRKKLPPKADILVHMPSGELAANLFLATQTEEKLRREDIKGKENANRTHHGVGQKIRQTIAEIGGTMPENYAAVPHVKDARKRLKKTKKLTTGNDGGG